MGYFKQLSLRARDDRRERSARARSIARTKEEKPLYDAVHIWSVENCDLRCVHGDFIMSIRDLLPVNPESNETPGGTLDDAEFIESYPNVSTLCFGALGPDGKPRQLSTLLFFVEFGAWKVRLSERNVRCDLWSGGKSFREAMDALEAQLSQRPVPWRKQTLPGKRS